MAAQDDIGSRGEAIFLLRLTDACDRPIPYFRAHFLGEKRRTLDFMVELVTEDDSILYFFAQVKATRKGLTRKGRLRVEMSAVDLRRAASCPAPVYLMGVDEPAEAVFVWPVLQGRTGPVSSIPTDHPLTGANLARLYDEVLRFWSERDMARRTSIFAD